MNKRQRSKRAWFRARLRKKGCVRRTAFFRYDFGGIHESYTTTSLMMVSRSGKYIPLHMKFDVNPRRKHEQVHERKTPDGSRPVPEAPGA